MNNPFDYIPDESCERAFQSLLLEIETLRASDRLEDKNLICELDGGKMLGVLVAIDSQGVEQALYAFSGQLGDQGFHHRLFVEPVLDYLLPDGDFKQKEGEISALNRAIETFENVELATIEKEFAQLKEKLDAELAGRKETYRQSKDERDRKRKLGNLNQIEFEAMVRQSQFEKAELRRLKKRLTEELLPISNRVDDARTRLRIMKAQRKTDSESLQKWLFSNFKVMNARGDEKSLSDIFSETALRIPPSGAGECCAPKLLQASYLRGLRPITMAEYWYGKPKNGEIRIHGTHYPACRGKCLPVLKWMLQGVVVTPSLENSCLDEKVNCPEIIYENEWFCVVNKPSGMLSVPGKCPDRSVHDWLTERYGPDRQVLMAHRLDQDTSGLLIAAFGHESYRTLQALFATHKIRKTYIALLDGNYQNLGLANKGHISLPLSADWLDRPRQRVDRETGKDAETDYEFIEVSNGVSRILFYPQTGRTHQLRVHSASEDGLGMPIINDRLYSRRSGRQPGRLMLHAHKLEFTFPLDNNKYTFESPAPF